MSDEWKRRSHPDLGRPPGQGPKVKEMVFTESRKEKILLLRKNALRFWREFRKSRGGMIGLTILAVFVMMAVLESVVATIDNPNNIDSYEENVFYDDPSQKNWTNPHPPSLDESPYSGMVHLLGTDYQGKDVYSMMVYGAKASLIVGMVASLISIVLGTTIGVAAGYFGKFSEEILMRFTDFFLVIPWFPLMIVFAFVLGPSFWNVIIVIGIVGWPSTARIVRAQVLSVKERVFIERARGLGASGTRIISKHIMPNVMPLIFANTIIAVANAIFAEAFLDFFGFGDPDVVSWGTMCEEAYNYGGFTGRAWWPVLAPGACIVMLIMSFYLIGDAVDEIVNPRLKRR